MEIDLQGIVVIVGNYGSGKTEVAVNLAADRKRAGVDVRLADLDLVNPYFRSREAKATLARLGVEVITPPPQYHSADLPILSPMVANLIRREHALTLLDAGGDDVGATVLAALADVLRNRPVRMLQVVNPCRPFTETIDGCLKIRAEIEAASKLKVDGLIGNANLIDETGTEDIYRGYDFVRALAARSGLPLEFVTVGVDLLPSIDRSRLACALLPIERQMVPPWRKAAALRPLATAG